MAFLIMRCISKMTIWRSTCIIMDTTKGKGVSYMTNSVDWHGKGPNDDEYKIAIEELNAAYAALEQEEN